MPVARQISRWRPQTGDGSVKLGYLAAVGGAMVGLIVRLLLAPYVDHRTLAIIYVPAVLAAAPVRRSWPPGFVSGSALYSCARTYGVQTTPLSWLSS